MADAIASYKDAFSSYTKNLADYLLYSAVNFIGQMAVVIILLVMVVMLEAMFIGSLGGVFSSGFTIETLGVGIVLLLLFVGSLLFLWLESGLLGAYCDTINMLLSGRKQSLGGYFGSIMRLGTPITLILIAEGLCMAVPLALLALASSMMMANWVMAFPIMLIAGLLMLLIALFFAFAVPAVVVDGKKAAGAIKTSFSFGLKHIFGLIIYSIVFMALSLIWIIPFYVPLFFAPIVHAALISLYKRAK